MADILSIDALIALVAIVALHSLSFSRTVMNVAGVSPLARRAPFVATGLALTVAVLLPDTREAVVFLGAATGQFASFVLISRFRNRGSTNLHLLASIASNGTWYATMHYLDLANAELSFMFLFVAGMIAGRTAGVTFAQYIEKRYKLVADATRDPRLSAHERLRYMSKQPLFNALLVGLISYAVYAVMYFDQEMRFAVLIVISLGLLQNFFYAINARAQNRGNSTYIAIAGVLAGSVFFVSAAYLFGKDMPWQLFVPYVLSTALGSATGAFFSMLIEIAGRISPDSHVSEKDGSQPKGKTRAPYVIIATFALAWVFYGDTILSSFGIAQHTLALPWLPNASEYLARELIIPLIALLFMLNSGLHGVVSRAGNRNHTGYHIASIIPKGIVDFTTYSYFVMNPSVIDIIPVAVLAGSLGSLYAKDIGEWVERRLKARMDVEE